MSGNGNKGNGNKNKKPANIKAPREAHWAETQATPSPGGTYYTYGNTPVLGTPKNNTPKANGNKKRKTRKARKTRRNSRK